MKILITGIGNIGKSTLREKVAHKVSEQVIQIDMDYNTHEDIPQTSSKTILIEDVHGLERNSDQYDKIIYLLPPSNHIILWLRRAWAWFSGGIVDLSNPKGVNKPYAISNIPIILKIVVKNVFFRKQWIRDDMQIIKKELKDRTLIIKKIDNGFYEMEKFITIN